MSAVGVRSWTTGFATRHGDGPIVNAKREGDRWHLTWKGGSALVEGDQDAAARKAEIAARLLAEADPIRVEYERILSELGRAVTRDEGEAE